MARHRIGAHIARHRDRHVSRRLAIVLVAIALLVPAGVLAIRSLTTSLMSEGPDPENGQLTSSTAERKVASAEVDSNPFRGTPAEKFAEGEAGIVVPQVGQQGSWSSSAIANALNQTKTVLKTARLDESTLTQGQTTSYVDQFSQSSRDFITKQLAGPSSLAYVTKLAPQYSLRAPIRVDGRMDVSVGNKGQLVISTNYVWVYPLRPPKSAKVFALPGSQLAVLHTVEQYEFYPDKDYAKRDRGLRPGEGEQRTYNVDCESTGKGILALPRKRDREPTAPPKPAYDHNSSKQAAPNSCARTG